MKAEIIKRTVLKDIPSASGVEIVNGIIYIIGDDSPYLYCLDHHLNIIEKIQLFPDSDFSTGRIPKALKKDLECMTSLTINNNKHLLVLGSGANDKREKGYLIKLPTKYNKKHFVQEIELKEFYRLLRANPEIGGNGTLNIEGIATSEKNIILFNRINPGTKNTALVFSLEEFVVFLTENNSMIPFPQTFPFSLPVENNFEAGFTGATVHDNKLIVTAAIEKTSNAIDDGAIAGSFIGYFDLNEQEPSRRDASTLKLKIGGVVKLNLTESNTLGKLESICIYEQEPSGKIIALAVTDDDQGGSEILMLDISL